jgi:hypothetical protein
MEMPRRKHVDIELDGIAKELGAEVYQEGGGFVCILPCDVHSSVVGRGASVAEAVNNWDAKLQAHLRNAGADDSVVLFVKAHLAKQSYVAPNMRSGKPTWTEKPQHVIDFENQFYTGKSKRK